MKPRPADERTEVLRVTIPADIWAHFSTVRDELRAAHRKHKIPSGDRGVRLVLRVWIEELLRGKIR